MGLIVVNCTLIVDLCCFPFPLIETYSNYTPFKLLRMCRWVGTDTNIQQSEQVCENEGKKKFNRNITQWSKGCPIVLYVLVRRDDQYTYHVHVTCMQVSSLHRLFFRFYNKLKFLFGVLRLSTKILHMFCLKKRGGWGSDLQMVSRVIILCKNYKTLITIFF